MAPAQRQSFSRNAIVVGPSKAATLANRLLPEIPPLIGGFAQPGRGRIPVDGWRVAAAFIREYGLYKEYDKFNTKIPGARRATYLIDTNGKVVEMQLDSEAIDPTKTVTLCEAEGQRVRQRSERALAAVSDASPASSGRMPPQVGDEK